MGSSGIFTRSNRGTSNYVFKNSISATASTPYSTVVTTPPVDMSGVDLMVIIVTDYVLSGSPSTPTDNLGNLYLFGATVSAGGNPAMTLFYLRNPTVSSSMLFAVPSVLNSFPGIIVLGFSGSIASPFDTSNVQGTTLNNNPATIQAGSITPSGNGELIIAAIDAYIAPTSPTIDSGFGTPIFQITNANQTYSFAVSYLMQTSAAAVNPTWSFNPGSANAPACALIACFK